MAKSLALILGIRENKEIFKLGSIMNRCFFGTVGCGIDDFQVLYMLDQKPKVDLNLYHIYKTKREQGKKSSVLDLFEISCMSCSTIT